MNDLMKVAAIAFGLSVGAMAATTATAQSKMTPAEIPPASFTGKQYVDSRGCVYVRAGFGGAVNWVPRMSRARKVVCGAAPTFAAAPPAATKPPRTATPPPRTTVAVAPPPKATPPARVAPPPPKRVVTAPPPARVAPPPATVNTACPGLSPLGQRYVPRGNHKVRCGPQPASPYVSGDASGVIHVPMPPKIAPPPGYKSAFDPEEGRFNPNRGHVTREGFVQMRLVWTAGVPRRLVNAGNGRDVTPLFPGLKYPFTSYRQQERYYAVNAVPNSDREFTITGRR